MAALAPLRRCWQHLRYRRDDLRVSMLRRLEVVERDLMISTAVPAPISAMTRQCALTVADTALTRLRAPAVSPAGRAEAARLLRVAADLIDPRPDP